MLRHSRSFTALWSARALSVLGDSVTVVALMMYVLQENRSGVAMGLLLLAEIAPSLCSPLAGALIDRYADRRLLVVCELGQGGIAAAMAIALPPFPVLVLLVVARAALATIVKPGALRAIPAIVEERSLPAANAFVRGAEEGATIAGPLLAAWLAPGIGVRGLFAIDATTFVLAALLLLRMPRIVSETPDAPGPVRGMLAASLAGVAHVLRSPVTRAAALGLFVFVSFAALENVALPFLAERDLAAGRQGVGLLYASQPAGLLVGLVCLGRWGGRFPSAPGVVAGMMIFAAGSVATSVAPSLALALATQFAAGIGNGIVVASMDTLVQRAVEPRLLGRAFANIYGGANLAAGLAYAAGGPLLDATSARTTFAIAGGGGLGASLLAAALLGAATTRP